MYLSVVYGSQNKQQSFPYTAFYNRDKMFTARFGLCIVTKIPVNLSLWNCWWSSLKIAEFRGDTGTRDEAVRDWTKSIVACVGVLPFGTTTKSLRYIPYRGAVPKNFLDTNQQRCRNIQTIYDHSRTVRYDVPTAARIWTVIFRYILYSPTHA